MKRIPVFLIACFILLFSCKQQSNISPKPFTSAMLARQDFLINADKDTQLTTLHGSFIHIAAGTFNSKEPINIEIREAFTSAEILAAGLTTTSNGRPLRSGGMIYFNATVAGDSIALQKPVAISMPNEYYDEQMEVFKGVETDSGMNWVNPEPVDTTPQSQNWIAGKQIFESNCTSCHKLNMDLTGPPLRGIERRWNNYWYLKQWIRNWNVAVANGWPVAIRAQNEKPTAMSIFEHLTDQQLDQVIAYITNESLKPGPPIDSPCADTIYLPTPKPQQTFLDTDLPVIIPSTDTSIIEERPDPNPVKRELEDTSSRGDDKRVQQIYTDGSYDFEITTNGWYNIDALIDVEGTTNVKLTATIEGNAVDNMTVYLFCPDKKIMINPTDVDGNKYLFNKFGDDGIPLFLNDRAILIAFGSKGDNMYLGATEFRIKEEETTSIDVEKTTAEKVRDIFREKKIGSIDIGIDKKEMRIHEIPCDLIKAVDTLKKAVDTVKRVAINTTPVP
ncbi:MAG TPA: cytochrome c [Chitinophagaceae bacterium]|nr:cytochrome c [Chitinophagaceae bacterium]